MSAFVFDENRFKKTNYLTLTIILGKSDKKWLTQRLKNVILYDVIHQQLIKRSKNAFFFENFEFR